MSFDETAHVKVRLDNFGQVSSVEITESSGDLKFDQSIQDAIHKSAPFFEFEALSPEDRVKFSEFIVVFKPGG